MQREVVVAPFVCAAGDCVCDSVHQGLVSHGYSTVAEVCDLDTSPETLKAACRTHLDASQWPAVVDHPAELDLLAPDLIDAMSQTAQRYPVGTLLRTSFDHRSGRRRYQAQSSHGHHVPPDGQK